MPADRNQSADTQICVESDVDFPPSEDECTGSASGSDDASADSDGESGDNQDIVVMSGDGGRDEADERQQLPRQPQLQRQQRR